MEREFTNALASIPLWQYAITVYPHHQADLLHWQASQNASVNILLALAFAQHNQQRLPTQWWRYPPFNRAQSLTRRIRSLRQTAKGEAYYPQLKDWELMMEGVEIQLLQSMMLPGDCKSNIAEYTECLKLKKGALAPFIDTLANG